MCSYFDCFTGPNFNKANGFIANKNTQINIYFDYMQNRTPLLISNYSYHEFDSGVGFISK